jgi:hypothetical protein
MVFNIQQRCDLSMFEELTENLKTLWPMSASELYRLSDRRLSAKLTHIKHTMAELPRI